VNGKIQVHMGPDGIDNADMFYLGTPKGAVKDHAGVVDHIAFLASEPGGFIRRFKERGVEYRPRSLPESDLYQIFVTDPNGLTIELNFFGLKDITDWGGESYTEMPRTAEAHA
jgi:catechol 2,3-dioxygenase-like lactoylglutathione lyase family enzyme